MNNIVQQICEEFINEVAGFFVSGSIRKIEEMETIQILLFYQ